jgi:hypothetical protein
VNSIGFPGPVHGHMARPVPREALGLLNRNAALLKNLIVQVGFVKMDYGLGGLLRRDIGD